MRRLSASVKLKAVKEVIDKGKSLKEVSARNECSRQSLFLWIKKYKQDPRKAASNLKNNYSKGRNHPRYLGWKIEKLILDLVVKNPDLSVRGLYKEVKESGYAVSTHGIYNALIRYDLVTRELRRRFAQTHPVKTLLAHTLTPAYRTKVVEEYLSEGQAIAKICQNWGISRPTFYSWLRRYQEAVDDKKVEALVRNYKKGQAHHRSLSRELEEAILEIVAKNPALSVHKIYASVPQVSGKPVAGHHGIQNVLLRNNLNTYERRLQWAAAQKAPEVVPTPTAAPAPARRLLIRILSPFATIPRLVISQPITWPVALPILLFAAYIFEVDKIFRPGVFFPIIALTFGLIFFLYSLKYYVSLIMVLWLGSKEGSGGDNRGAQSDQEAAGGFFGKIKTVLSGSKAIGSVGLVEDLSHVQLTSRPFVSVHVPIYNEKRVVERVMKACSSFNWLEGDPSSRSSSGSSAAKAAYEVIIVDDSTDETTEIAKQCLVAGSWLLVKTEKDEEKEIFIYQAPVTSYQLPIVKLIHRASRSGFKGGALQKALEQTDKRAQYILVFDADFVPYPDTVEQFVKYFQLVGTGTSGQGLGARGANLDSRPYTLDAGSNIAAVQGYQWHVLNKSENWITRGVRSEYAGSYVVERSAIELYGGLKMIAGSVYCIRSDLLRQFGWGTSITEDLELTLRLYASGYKVVYTPYIQAPAEAVSTIRRLIRQRMRWAEGHSFNVRKQFRQIVASPHLTFSEKFEFAYLTPYYLQAAFFVVGTFAWFLAEVIFKVNLPFWTAALGWSLVFSNFLALPLVNLLGLFLEQSEERDYLGVFSFVLLSYIVTPFQAYAAVKGFLEKEEGPWFRTPKTGHITDVVGRSRVGHWSFNWPFGGPQGEPATAEVSGIPNTYNLAPVSAFNPLTGYNIRPKRISLVSRSVIAALMVVVMLVNYLAFFAEPKPAKAVGTPKIEQQINIIDQEYSTTNTSYQPANNSLGLILWSGTDNFSDISAVYFEAVIKNSASSNTTTAGLFRSTDLINPVTSSTVTTTYTSYTRVRTSADIKGNLVTGARYTAQIKTSAGTASIQAARLIILQVGAVNGMITKTWPQVEVGYAGTLSGTTYNFSTASDEKVYLVDWDVFNPLADWWYFEATLKSSGASSFAYASLFSCGTSDLSGNCTTQLTSSEVFVSGTSFDVIRSGALSLTDNARYAVKIKNSTTDTTTIANAKIIARQNDATNGIQATELVQQQINQAISPSSTTFANKNFDNQYSPGDLSGSDAIYFEQTGRGTIVEKVYYSAESRLDNVTNSDIIDTPTSSTVASSSIALGRTRSAELSANSDWPSAAKNMDAEIRGTNASANIEVTNTWIIIQLTSIPVPEAAILALPGMLFLPKLIRWVKEKREARKKKAAGSGKPKSRMLANCVF